MTTSEFWMHLFGVVVATFLLVGNYITSDQWVTVFVILIPSYGIARTVVKVSKNSPK